MPDLEFHVEGAEPVPYAAAPHLAFKLRITQPVNGGRTPLEIHTVALRCQVRIEPGKRRYSSGEQKKLIELFGEPHRWAQTLHSMLWVNAAMTVPAFAGETRADLLVPCTFDFNVAQTKYFHALDDGQVPLSLLFSGTVFYAGDEGALQVELISWEKEAGFRMDVLGLEEDDGDVLPQQRMALSSARRLRQVASLQDRPRRGHVGAGVGGASCVVGCRGSWAGAAMSSTTVNDIARAVLYEGYMLYPYRRSVKNTQRWTFGGIFPRDYGQAAGGADPVMMQAQCLLAGPVRGSPFRCASCT